MQINFADLMRDPRIIYFCAGSVPTLADIVAARDLGRNVVFRNGSVAADDAAPEACDGVAGPAIPSTYDGRPDGAEVIETRNSEIDALLAAAQVEETEEQREQAKAVKAAATEQKQAAKAAATGKAANWTPGVR